MQARHDLDTTLRRHEVREVGKPPDANAPGVLVDQRESLRALLDLLEGDVDRSKKRESQTGPAPFVPESRFFDIDLGSGPDDEA